MKATKRLILTLAAILGMTGAWAQDTEDEVAVTEDAAVYDLQGRRVMEPTKKGLYIVNGKKVVIK